jgi:hypothetical protein
MVATRRFTPMGAIRHVDHKTVCLHVWHRVVLNT